MGTDCRRANYGGPRRRQPKDPMPAPETNGLLPHYARTLARVRTEDVGLSFVKMADALNGTRWRVLLGRGGTAVHPSSIKLIESAKHWPRDPNAWISAYAELTGQQPIDLWGEAMERWSDALKRPTAVRAAKQLPRP